MKKYSVYFRRTQNIHAADYDDAFLLQSNIIFYASLVTIHGASAAHSLLRLVVALAAITMGQRLVLPGAAAG